MPLTGGRTAAAHGLTGTLKSHRSRIKYITGLYNPSEIGAIMGYGRRLNLTSGAASPDMQPSEPSLHTEI